MKIYLAKAAAKAAGISHRHLMRLTQQLGKQKSVMGGRRLFIYSERDLAQIRELKRT